MQYLYRKHAQSPVVLENEPKCLDLGRLNIPKINARLARASILGHNKILWAEGSGFARQGEEVQDLGIGAEEEMPKPTHGESSSQCSALIQCLPSPSTADCLSQLHMQAMLRHILSNILLNLSTRFPRTNLGCRSTTSRCWTFSRRRSRAWTCHRPVLISSTPRLLEMARVDLLVS